MILKIGHIIVVCYINNDHIFSKFKKLIRDIYVSELMKLHNVNMDKFT